MSDKKSLLGGDVMQEDISGPSWDELRPVLRSLDFNLRNILCAIRGYAELLEEQIGTSTPVSADLRELRESAERCAEIERILQDLIRDPVSVIAKFKETEG
jgi:signal transduction histidine kinase